MKTSVYQDSMSSNAHAQGMVCGDHHETFGLATEFRKHMLCSGNTATASPESFSSEP